MIFVIDDDEIMAECVARWAKNEVKIFTNAIEAMNAISEGDLPDLIFLDILLDGPDGFSFLNEMVSYNDTAKIPVVVVSSLDLSKYSLAEYGVVKILNKDTMVPADIEECVNEHAK